MMKKIQRALALLSSLFFLQTGFAASGPLFRVSSTGTPDHVSITLCLNGKGPLSCQNYTVTALDLSILTTAPNHTYPAAGIKINTPGYIIKNVGIDCTPIANGYCLFSVSNSLAKHLSLQKEEVNIPPVIAGGSYNDVINSYPLLTISTNGGATWEYKIEKGMNLPTDYSNGSFNNTSCSDRYCIAGGLYDDSITNFPLLATSTDSGNTWAYKIEKGINLPTDYSAFGFILSTSCNGRHCSACGRYDDGLIAYPLLTTSADGGATWTYKIEKGLNLPTDFSGNGSLLSTQCQGTHCITGGVYSDNTNAYPLLAISANGGGTWTYKIEKGLNLPTDFSSSGSFNSTSCYGSHCVAGGQYSDIGFNYPLLAISADGGGTWVYKIEKGTNLPTDYAHSGIFNSTSCNGTHCTAGGQYNDGTTMYPLLATSANGGATWIYKIEKGRNLPRDFSNAGSIDSTECNGIHCIAGGQYFDGAKTYPLLALSSDGGATWTYKIEKDRNLPTDFSNSGSIISANCNDLYCVAGGQYSDATKAYPLLATSANGGATWTYTIEKGMNLPADYNNAGIINGASITNITYLPKSLHFLKKRLKAQE